ncbi:Acyl-CoA reductase [Parafrankia irregularis]|uniref:Acyl-CoA reductase n=1 Tax=Parafrankia irregularis TaxID=795642 RepID=A0A0S4QKN9_9ACTN|nr:MULTISPECIES: aldehyde dehydrogenase family protein [Parafrankia]MBE3202333.1 aldehyde dehydrogenase family protein [Parafrankia sp. CH37]CUU56087.1 Acyl-CoA reductase [Parafrankia irregularis]
MSALETTAAHAGSLFIGGDPVPGAAGRYPVIDPASEELVGEAPQASPEQAHEAAAAARAAWGSWSRTAPERRAELLGRIADLLITHNDELVGLVQAETGATARVAQTMQVPVAVDRFRRYAKEALDPVTVPLPPQPMPATPLAPGGLIGAVAVRQPVGVVACITPYNFPLVSLAGKVAPALAMGNTVVVKPAPQDPLQILRFAEIVAEAGVPPGVVNVVTGSAPSIGAALVDSPDVDMISFTGSTQVGQAIAAAAGRDMKRVLMELGGKGAAIVFDDADLDAAVGGIGSTWSFHSGQICTAPTRVLVQRGVRDALVDRLTAYAGVCRVGDPRAADTVVGPVISAAHRDRVEVMIEKGVAEGATLAVGGHRPASGTGFYVAPTLFTDVKPGMSIAREEFFAPVVVLMTFTDEDEAVELANDSPFGLSDYVWTADTGRGYRVARRLRSGSVGINTVQRNHETPFGGFKHSGVGRDCGTFAMHAYSELQSIVWSS